MAKAFGVDVQPSGMVGGPNPMQDEAGIALGQASLTVEEQATTIATLADKGVYHSPHVIKKIIVGNRGHPGEDHHAHGAHPRPGGGRGLGAVGRHRLDGGTAAGLGLDNGQPVIAKTGTTNLSQSAFFMAATPKYAMADAMFVNKPGCTCPKSACSPSARPPRPWRSRRRRACRRCSASAACPVTAGSSRRTSGTSSS